MNLRLLLLALWLATPFAAAQTIQWDPPGGPLAVGQTVQFRLVCRDCQPAATPAPPKIDGLILRYQGTSSAYSFGAGGAAAAEISLVFLAHWSKNERLVIPAFSVVTNRGSITVPEAVFEPATATVGESGKPLSAAASARLDVQPAEVWAGQVFNVSYRIEADVGYQPDFAHSAPEWAASGLTAEDWAAPEQYETHPASGSRAGLLYRTRALASRPGEFTIPPTRQLVNLNVGMNLFGFAPTPRYEQFSVASPAITVTARPLPPAPAGFAGAVGRFTIESRVVPLTAGLHEPVTWTVSVHGTGNWPQIKSLPRRPVPAGFKVVHPQVQRTPAPGRLFDATMSEDVVLVPSRSGHFTLPAVEWVYFDPDAGVYRTASTAPAAIDVAPAAERPELDETQGPGGVRSLPAAPEDPHGLPADPLPTGKLAAAPLAPGSFAVACLAPFGAVVLLWIGLAARRAWENDPGRARRAAWQRQAGAIRAVAAARTPAELRPALSAWQREAVEAWGLAGGPYPSSFASPEQARAWAESEAAIYGPTGALPPDWTARAAAVLRAAPPPPFRWGRTFLPHQLWPWAAAFFLAASLPAHASAGQPPAPGGAAVGPGADASALYSAGEYARAAAAWAQASPLDPAARHNRSLALAQLGRWDEAAAQAAAAFVQRPGDPEIYRQFAAACEKAGVGPGPLTAFLAPTPQTSIARRLSPAQWQQCAPLACAALALGLALLLFRAYRRPRAGLLLIAAAVAFLIAGAALGAGAWLAARTYGLAADPQACLVVRSGSLRSIPSEAVPNQATTPVSAGTVAIPDRSFLTWVRLKFSDGGTGWIRRTEITPLWK